MANKEQLAILKQGVAAWNKWREENHDAKIDLSDERLQYLNMSGINLSNADIRAVKFDNSSCKAANFSGVIIGYLPTSRNSTNFRTPTDFSNADLTDAVFDNAQIGSSHFSSAIINNTSWRNAKFSGGDFGENILSDIYVCDLLKTGSGREIPLKGKNLKAARLVNFDLRDVDLRETNLVQANLSGADITGAKLWGSARENWIIDGIRCDYVYWDEAGEQRTPPDRDFRPGEFEELYRQLPTFEYVFANGFTPLDPLIMDRVVQAINERHEEFSLELVNFDKRGEPHATFTVCHLDYVEKAKEQITAGYEQNKIAPEQQEQLMKIISKLIDNNAMMAGNQSKSLEIIKQLEGAAMRDKYSITVGNGGQVGGIGDHAAVSGNTFQQVIYSNDFQLNISDLSRLHQAMRNTAASPEQKAAAEDVAKAEQAARQQDEPTMRQHLKNAGKFALDCAKEIGTEALAEYLKKITVG